MPTISLPDGVRRVVAVNPYDCVYRNLPSLIAARAHYPQVTAPVHLIYGDKDWSRTSDRRQLPHAEFTEVPNAGHFIALERPDVPADLLKSHA